MHGITNNLGRGLNKSGTPPPPPANGAAAPHNQHGAEARTNKDMRLRPQQMGQQPPTVNTGQKKPGQKKTMRLRAQQM